MRISLSIAIGDYDINQALIDGTVCPDGVDLIPMSMPSPERHWRMLVNGEFSVCELSLGSFVARLSRGNDDLVAIPVYPHRRFRHGYLFVSGKHDAIHPRDLVGASLGVRSWQTTAGRWLRGILADYYELPTEEVEWVAQDAEDVPLDLPAEIRLRSVEAGKTVTDMCARGELAGLVYPEIPEQVHNGDGSIRRMFADPKLVEQQFYRDTNIFPIMHLVVIRADVVDKYPFLPRALFDAFEESKALAVKRLRDPRRVSLAWLRYLQDEERALLGPDPWNYGLDEQNEHTLSVFLDYAVRQGIAARRMKPAQLFHPATIGRPPHYT